VIALLIATVVLGLVLGRLFKVYVLIPTCCLATAVAFAGPTLGYESLTNSVLDLVLLLASLEIGYFLALASKNLQFSAASRTKLWRSPRARAESSGPLHLFANGAPLGSGTEPPVA
jgi:hypothetical protein